MSLYYLDSSAWIKRYFNETGSASLRALFDAQAALACWRFGLVEVIAAVSRRAHHEGIDPVRIAAQAELARRDVAMFTYVELTEKVWACAEALGPRHHMRGADALHFAAAMAWVGQQNDQIVMLSSDVELARAAGLEGLNVLNPLVVS